MKKQQQSRAHLCPFEYLPSETITHIFTSTASVGGLSAVLALARSSHRLQQIFLVHRLSLLTSAIDTTYGPLQDAIQLVTQNSSQAPYLTRNVPISIALLRDIILVGKIARRWEGIYSLKRWQGEQSVDRRLLDINERRRLRRAIYRVWLYSKAYHNPYFTRNIRRLPTVQEARARLLHGWSLEELGEIVDMKEIFRRVLSSNVCPSNTRVTKKVSQRYGEEYAVNLFFPTSQSGFTAQNQLGLLSGSTHYQYLTPSRGSRYMISARHDPAMEGFGDDISHYYQIADMLKLNPQQILHLYENTFTKLQVEAYVQETSSYTEDNVYTNPQWFDNNGETLGETIQQVLYERGVDVQDFEDDVGEGWHGVGLNAEAVNGVGK